MYVGTGRYAATKQGRTARSPLQSHRRYLLAPTIGKHGTGALTGAQRWRAPCPGTPPAGRPGLAGWRGPAGVGGLAGGGTGTLHVGLFDARSARGGASIALQQDKGCSTACVASAPAPAPRPAAAPTSMFFTTRSVTHSQWRPAGGARHLEGLKRSANRVERCMEGQLRCWAQRAAAEDGHFAVWMLAGVQGMGSPPTRMFGALTLPPIAVVTVLNENAQPQRALHQRARARGELGGGGKGSGGSGRRPLCLGSQRRPSQRRACLDDCLLAGLALCAATGGLLHFVLSCGRHGEAACVERAGGAPGEGSVEAGRR